MTKRHNEEDDLDAPCVYAVCIRCSKNWIKNESKANQHYSIRISATRVENMTDFFLFFFLLLFMMQSAPLTMGQNVEYIHSIKCHFSSPSPSSSSFFYSLCLRIVVKRSANKQTNIMHACVYACMLGMCRLKKAILSHYLTIKWHQPFIYAKINGIYKNRQTIFKYLCYEIWCCR